jgi:hypothetical protein
MSLPFGWHVVALARRRKVYQVKIADAVNARSRIVAVPWSRCGDSIFRLDFLF